MQRHLLLFSLLTCALAGWGRAQENPSVVADAQRQEAEERYRRMNAKIEDLEATIQSYQQRFVALAEEINQVRQEVARARENAKDPTVHENLKRLAEKIQEVDEKRLADNEKVLLKISEVQRGLLDRSAPPSKPKPTAGNNSASSGSSGGGEKGYEYTVQKNDSLSRIVTALNKQGIKVSSKQVMEANPKVKWTSLQIGQKIFIPSP